jgi:DNA modification methylase
MEYCRNYWIFNGSPGPRKQNVHRAAYPLELPRRVIHLYSGVGDLVADFFCGSGTTAVAAYKLGRRFVVSDACESFVNHAHREVLKLINANVTKVCDKRRAE